MIISSHNPAYCGYFNLWCKCDIVWIYMATNEKLNILDPRKTKCLALYKDPTSDTFGNLKKSAIMAGFSVDYADTLFSVRPDWLMDNIMDDVQTIKDAEHNLRKYTSHKLKVEDIETKRDIEIAKIQLDASKFVLKTQARVKYNDDEQKAQTNVQVNIINYDDEPDKTPTVTVHTAPIDPIGY